MVINTIVPYLPGDVITAERLNEIVDALNKMIHAEWVKKMNSGDGGVKPE